MRIKIRNEDIVDGASQVDTLLGEGPDPTLRQQREVEDIDLRSVALPS